MRARSRRAGAAPLGAGTTAHPPPQRGHSRQPPRVRTFSYTHKAASRPPHSLRSTAKAALRPSSLLPARRLLLAGTGARHLLLLVLLTLGANTPQTAAMVCGATSGRSLAGPVPHRRNPGLQCARLGVAGQAERSPLAAQHVLRPTCISWGSDERSKLTDHRGTGSCTPWPAPAATGPALGLGPWACCLRRSAASPTCLQPRLRPCRSVQSGSRAA